MNTSHTNALGQRDAVAICTASTYSPDESGPGMKGIWSLKATSLDAFDTFLVLTFVGETRILAINSDDELDEAEIEGFDSEAQVGPALC